MSQETAPADWTPTVKIRWCTEHHVNPDGTTTTNPELEQWFVSPEGVGAWFLVPNEVD